MPAALMPLIAVHISAVLAKLGVFFVIPRLRSVEQVRTFLSRYRPFDKLADWILWLTGAGLLFVARWHLIRQTWFLVSMGLYLLVFLAIRFALTAEMRKISESKKIHAVEELRRLRFNNWCIAIMSFAFLAIIAYLMMTRP